MYEMENILFEKHNNAQSHFLNIVKNIIYKKLFNAFYLLYKKQLKINYIILIDENIFVPF